MYRMSRPEPRTAVNGSESLSWARVIWWWTEWVLINVIVKPLEASFMARCTLGMRLVAFSCGLHALEVDCDYILGTMAFRLTCSILSMDDSLYFLLIAPVCCCPETVVVPLSLVAWNVSLVHTWRSAPVALVVLGLALLVEFSVDASVAFTQFKTRVATRSSDIANRYDLKIEPEYLKVQYWVTSVSCFAVLVFLFFVIRWSLRPSSCSSFCSSWYAKIILCCILVYSTLCCMSLATITQDGLQTALKLFWVLCHGFASVKLIQHLLHSFRSCASVCNLQDVLIVVPPRIMDYSLFLGEALLVTAGLILYFGDMLAYTISKVQRNFSTPVLAFNYGIKRSEISVIIQGMLVGLLLFPVLAVPITKLWGCFIRLTSFRAFSHNEIHRALIFYSSLAFLLTLIIPYWMQFVHDFPVHPHLWMCLHARALGGSCHCLSYKAKMSVVFMFVFSDPLKRLSLCFYWIAVICVSVVCFYNISKNSKIQRILLRRYYHLMAVSMFLPALIFQVWKIWPLGPLVHQFMNALADHRDSELLVVSHFSLLLGCALPIWMSSGFNDRPLAPFAGILSLGIGDTMASVVGYKYGVLRWSKTGKKTVEGTAAGTTSVLATCFVLLPLLASTGYILTQHWVSLFVAVTASGLLEAYTAQLDNAFIPLVFYSLLCL
ncbi:hypothetical protein RJ641_033116 [Dillenia turbinata]|uniref:dolichol kinase n=1 Tax=Dillenia turbinata TaxID=194707 RepID=A0AAN8VUP1_9MAGN